jgi:hypothetical protein
MVSGRKIFGTVRYEKERCFTHEEPHIQVGSLVWYRSSSLVVDGIQSFFEEVLIYFIHRQSMSFVREKHCLMIPQDFYVFSNLFFPSRKRTSALQTNRPANRILVYSERSIFFWYIVFCCITLNIRFDSIPGMKEPVDSNRFVGTHGMCLP